MALAGHLVPCEGQLVPPRFVLPPLAGMLGLMKIEPLFVLCAFAACASAEVRNAPRPPAAFKVPEEAMRDPQQRMMVTEQLRRQYEHQRSPELREPLFAAGFTAKEVDYIAGPAVLQPRAESHLADVRREIEAANREMAAAFNRGDLRAVAGFYSDDARIVGPGRRVVRGKSEIERYWTGIDNPRSWKLDVLEVGGDAGGPWQLGRSTLVAGADGRTSVVDFIAVWRRQPDGRLRIYVDMYVPSEPS